MLSTVEYALCNWTYCIVFNILFSIEQTVHFYRSTASGGLATTAAAHGVKNVANYDICAVVRFRWVMHVIRVSRSGLPQTQNYCLQAFFNMTRNEDFAMALAKSHMVEAFIVGCMVHTARQAVVATSADNLCLFFRGLSVFAPTTALPCIFAYFASR